MMKFLTVSESVELSLLKVTNQFRGLSQGRVDLLTDLTRT